MAFIFVQMLDILIINILPALPTTSAFVFRFTIEDGCYMYWFSLNTQYINVKLLYWIEYEKLTVFLKETVNEKCIIYLWIFKWILFRIINDHRNTDLKFEDNNLLRFPSPKGFLFKLLRLSIVQLYHLNRQIFRQLLIKRFFELYHILLLPNRFTELLRQIIKMKCVGNIYEVAKTPERLVHRCHRKIVFTSVRRKFVLNSFTCLQDHSIVTTRFFIIHLKAFQSDAS